MWPDRRQAQHGAIPGSLPPHVNQHSIHYRNRHQTYGYQRVTNPGNTLIICPFGTSLGQWFNELRPPENTQSTHQRYVFIPGITSQPVWCEISLRTYVTYGDDYPTAIYINSIPDNQEHQVSSLRMTIDAEWINSISHNLRSFHILQDDVQLVIAHSSDQFNHGYDPFPPLDTDNHSQSSENETSVCPACVDDEVLQLTH